MSWWHKYLLRPFLIWLMETRVYEKVLLKYLPNIRLTTKYSEIEGWQHTRLLKALSPGDIILAIDHHNITGFLITKITGGEVSHAAFCVNKGTEFDIAEMEAEGFTKSTLYDICKRADRVIIGTCSDWDDLYREQMVLECLTYDGSHYDTKFKLEDLTKQLRLQPKKGAYLACSELVFVSDFEGRLKANVEDVAGIGRPYVSPEGIRRAPNFVVKADTALMVR